MKTNSNSHQVLGINYFRQKAIAVAVILGIIFLTVCLTKKVDDSSNVESRAAVVPDNKDGSWAERTSGNNGGQSQNTEKASIASQKSGGSDGAGVNNGSSSGQPAAGSEKQSEESISISSPANPKVGPPPVKKSKTLPANLDFNKETNVFTWNVNCAESEKLVLKITDINGNLIDNFTVTGKSSFTFNPNKGIMQGKRLQAKLISEDNKVKLESEGSSEEFYPNCSSGE